MARGSARGLGLVVVFACASGCASTPREERLASDVALRVPTIAPVATTSAPAAIAAHPDTASAIDIDAALARGETVALIVWQTWCAACTREAPAIEAAHARHGDAIRFVGVVPGKDADVDAAEVAARRASWGYGFEHGRDRDLALCHALGVAGTPAIVVLGPGRVVRHRGRHAPTDWAALRGPRIAPAAGADGCEGGVCPLPDAREGSAPQ